MTQKNILLLGSTSFTGSHILHHLGERHTFIRVSRDADRVDVVFNVLEDEIDSLSDHLALADVVINCFSNGDVDSCENNPGPSTALNYEFPVALCQAQKEYEFHLIHFSSNAVYDGDQPPYSEQSPHLPINIYGELKSRADKYLLSESTRCTVLRPITMFGQLLGEQRHNPFSFFFDRLHNNEAVVAVNDVYVNMLHIDVLIDCIEKVIDDEIYGEFNISGDDSVNRLEFVMAIKDHLPGSTSLVTETDSSGFVTAAKRPLNTSFENSRMKAVLGVYPQPINETIERLVHKAKEQESRKAA